MTEFLKNRRTVYLTCLGIDIYMLTLFVSQFAFAASWNLTAGLIEFPQHIEAMLDGLIMIVSVLLGMVLLWLFVSEQQDKRRLFEDKGLTASVFERNRKFGIIRLIGYATLLYTLQIISIIFLSGTEAVLNIFGYTVSYSPAMNADYEASIQLMLYAMLIGPAVEELVFRGFVLKALEPCGKVFAITVSALAFSLMHGDIQQILFTFLAGLLFAYAASEYSIWASLILHIINNAVFSELSIFLSEHLPEVVFGVLSILSMIVSIIITVLFIKERLGRIKEFIRQNMPVRGVWKMLLNRWFIAFAFFSVLETAATVMPL